MIDSNDKNKRHYSKEQIYSAIGNKNAWIDLINNIAGSSIIGKKQGEPCPICGGNDRFVFDNSQNHGNNLCRKCDGGSNKSAKSRTGLRLIVDILNCTFDAACTFVGDHLRLTPEKYNSSTPPKKQQTKQPASQITDKDKKFSKAMITKALDGAISIEGTPGEIYLKSRGLRVDYPIKNLRFNKIERYEKDKSPTKWLQNALIAKLTDAQGKIEGLQRIYLKSDNSKDTRKQTSQFTGHSNEQAQASVKLFDPQPIMGIAEGVETALAAHEISGLPVWAALNAGRLICWIPPKITQTIFIFADLDQSNTGYECATKLYYNLKALGKEVYILLPGTISPEKKSIDFLDFHCKVRGLTYSIERLKSMSLEVKNINDDKYEDWKSLAPVTIFLKSQLKTNKTTGHSTPKSTLDNLSKLLDFYKIELKYNQITKQPEFTFPDMASFINKGEELKSNASLGQIIDLMTINDMPITNLDAYLQTLQQKHSYNPVKNWINSKVWDEHDYISDLLDTVEVNTITTDNPENRIELKNILIKKWLLGACALAFELIEEFPFVLVLQSIKQGIGKTFWFRKLAPAEWRVDGVTLEVGNADSERKALSHWLCELGEVDGTIRKSSMDSIKAFLSCIKDILRTPYAKYANTFRRRTAFFGTCNPTEFLRDDENRRFWVLPINKINSYHQINMQQVWAQCLHLLKTGETHLLNSAENELLTESNQEFLPEHIIEAAIRKYYNLNCDNKNEFKKLTPQEILAECKFSASDRQRYARICGRYFNKAFGTRQRSHGKTWYMVPPIFNEMTDVSTEPFGEDFKNNEHGDIPF